MKLSLVLLPLLLTYCVNSEKIHISGLGTVTGSVTESEWTKRPIYSFYGLRYAKSPSGYRRFMPPELVDPWEGEYNATTPGRVCPQLYNRDITYNGDEDYEDCLFLNIFIPVIPYKSKQVAKLPVMIYFHGGGFYESSAKPFPPNYLLEEDVILIVPQYRLGPLGFLSLETDGISGNYGLMDMVASLEWVNKYIVFFGGDNTRVTVFGQSAGSASILLMLMSPMVKESYFHQAILQSGSGTNSWLTNEDPLSFALTYFKELTNITDKVSRKVMEIHFRNATVEDLHKTLLKVLDDDPFAKSSKVVIQTAGKATFLEYHPVDLLRIGKLRSVPMMTGVTRHDGSFLVTYLYQILKANNLLENSDYLKNNLTRDIIQLFDIPDDNWALTDLLESKYFADIFYSRDNITFADVLPGMIDIAGLLYFKSGVFRQAKSNANFSPTYLYTFDYSGEHTRFGYDEDTSNFPFDGGVHHSNDLLYLFPYHYDSFNDDDRKMARIMVDLWTSFAITGKPSSLNVVHWEPFSKGKYGPYLHINTTSYMEDNFIQNEFKTF